MLIQCKDFNKNSSYKIINVDNNWLDGKQDPTYNAKQTAFLFMYKRYPKNGNELNDLVQVYEAPATTFLSGDKCEILNSHVPIGS
jgi:hypothetical protein